MVSIKIIMIVIIAEVKIAMMSLLALFVRVMFKVITTTTTVLLLIVASV